MGEIPHEKSSWRGLILGDGELAYTLNSSLERWEFVVSDSGNTALDAHFSSESFDFDVVIATADAWSGEASRRTLAQVRERAAILGVLDPGASPAAANLEENCDACVGRDALPARAGNLLRLLAEITRSRQRNLVQEEEIRMLRQRVRVLDQVSQAIIGADLSGRIKAWNKRAEKIFGYTREEMLGRPLKFIFDQNPANSFHLHKVLEPLLIHDRHHLETDIRRRDGGNVPIHASLTLEKNSRGDVVGVICCCRDISARRRMEGEKRAAFQRLEFFIERMPLAFIEWNADGTIRAWNHSAEQMFGYTSREAIGQPFSLMVKDDFIPDARRIFELMKAKRGGYRSRNENVTKDGRVIMCDWNNTTLVSETGDVVGFASIVDNITEQIRTEEELKRSREIAEAANRSKNEFLAVMSHEVRTPMNSILGFADLLMELINDEEQIELVNIIKANAFNLLELISNVLNYSRLESEQVRLESQETDLDALLSEIAEIASAEAQEKGLEFATEIEKGTPRHFMADYMELRQVLLNLAANAVKFTHEGEVRIHVSATPLPADYQWSWELLFSVSDTGIGIDENQKEKLFQSFTQLDSSSTRQYGGTGLGLAICRRIVELWDGRIWAAKNRGAGSTFHFTLPTQQVAHVEPDITDEDVFNEIEDDRFVEVFPLRILLVSPSQSTRDILDRIFANLGYEMATLTTGLGAIEHLQDNARDLIIIDDAIDDFMPAEIISLIRDGQAGAENQQADLALLTDAGTDRKQSASPMPFPLTQIKKPIIARNVRLALRKFAINRHTGADSARTPGPTTQAP